MSTALDLARGWYDGHEIDGAPALAHAVKVAVVLGRHAPRATPELIAAVLVHDSPEFAPQAGVQDVYGVLTAELSGEVARVVQALAAEHARMDSGGSAEPPLDDLPTVLASAADKAVSLESVLDRGETAPDPDAYWRARPAFLTAVPYFRDYYSRAAGVIPRPLADVLRVMVIRAELAACRHTPA